jgi:hypothetical protein
MVHPYESPAAVPLQCGAEFVPLPRAADTIFLYELRTTFHSLHPPQHSLSNLSSRLVSISTPAKVALLSDTQPHSKTNFFTYCRATPDTN